MAVGSIAVCFLQARAFAQSGETNAECRPNPHLPRAKEQYDDLQFEDAAQTLQRAIEYAGNCRDDLAEIYRLKAFVESIHAERERCRRSFEIFSALRPKYAMPPDISPKIRTCFLDAQSVAAERRELFIRHEAPREVPPGAPAAIRVDVVDPLRLVDKIKVFFRREGLKVYTAVSVRADDQVSVVIPALALVPDTEGYKMEYFVRAVDRWDGVLSEEGTPRDPHTFSVSKDTTSRGIAWPIWVVAGVGAAGAVVLTVVLATAKHDQLSLEIHERVSGP